MDIACNNDGRSVADQGLFNRGLFVMLLAGMALTAIVVPAKDSTQYAFEFKETLATKILPYWFDTAQDRQRGGYLMADDAAKKAAPATEKQLVTQSRMVWGFAHAYRQGYANNERDYLAAARQGYQFLLEHFLDREQGGYFWTTDLDGRPLSDNKILYGESFVMYAFVEYYRASADQAALQHAMDLYQTIQKRAHDAKYGGWIEHFRKDWTPMLTPTPAAVVEVAGYKSANTHLHLMEALTELYETTRDPNVRKSLEESVEINQKYFYPLQAGQSCFHRQRDWQPVTDSRSAGLSYGHNVEFAWLMVRAETVLGHPPSWTHFDAHLQHALKYGYDHQRGGLYNRGLEDQPANNTDKVWWVQSEMLAALTDGLKHGPNPAYAEALDQLLDFIVRYQADPKDGIWLDTVTAEGQPKVTAKAHNWKANYHDVRAIVKFIGAFAVRPNEAESPK